MGLSRHYLATGVLVSSALILRSVLEVMLNSSGHYFLPFLAGFFAALAGFFFGILGYIPFISAPVH
tara:strand:+ start:195 stop:392 length:198 start_codon:yes stop_codon:yes gene_type:complete